SRKPIRLLDAEYDVLGHAIERARFMLQMFALGEMPYPEPATVSALRQLQQVLDDRASAVPPVADDAVGEMAGLEPDADLAARMVGADSGSDASFDDGSATASELELELEPEPEPEPELEQEASPSEPLAGNLAPVIEPALGQAFVKQGFIGERDIAPETAVALKDDLDADLMPVFIEEALDMLPQIGHTLRVWQQTPSDIAAPQALLRLLHTIKGSARMAGAMRLGQHMHEMESRIEQVMHISAPSPQVWEDLLARHDIGLQMFDALQNPPVQAGTAPDLLFQPDAAADGSITSPSTLLSGGLPDRRATPRPVVEVLSSAGSPVPMVRVRADILDRLVNQAGEVSIARSKLENEVDAMRQSLLELTENVDRLRQQLREVEMQAESQIETQNTSRRANTPEKEFDPLEFDRFTRLQELTRMMAESVSDVGSVQQNLSRTLDSASLDLSNQARLTRDLQQDLMRVRMVQFASVSERLYRVTRQASKEVDKRITLDIRGSAVEIDRSVLERMAGPFEHLLRNAIVHGIESRAVRVAAGKREVGELLVEIRQEGNEVVIEFSDDGQGLDLERIREKATATGLIGSDHPVSQAELTDLIFHPGFSTQAVVTELAGRGVGMDVVRSEAAALGGRVAIFTETGKGAHFTVHLPLTLAVTQVVLLTTGGKTFAVPSVLVEQVQQLKTQALTVAYNEGSVTWQSQRVPMAYLATLLGEHDVSAVAQQYSPLMILKSGNDRIAIHVDEILGNREVVVKNIGPQLARLAGIAGATVLGSGEIVLILNPVALAQRAAQDNVRAPRLGTSDAPHGMGAVAEMDGAAGTPRSSQAVTGLRTQNIVMVVDDSLTVRRVTQRLLSREGYQVVLAKDGVDALEQMQSITPDVMLVDIEMPRMDGFDLTRNVRSDERTRHIPIIMITSRTASKHRNYAFELGVNDYLGKPYQEETLLAAVAAFLNQERALS
ncbi:MAG: response regulator, partial [Herminiimonas sp.]|nr:response regulator [Herminiimonas sp.]